MAILETQLDAYLHVQETGGLRQRQILQLLKQRGLTAWQIANALDVPLHWVSGRLTELRELGQVEPTNIRRLNPRSHRSGTVWILRKTK